jgi:chromate transporter
MRRMNSVVVGLLGTALYFLAGSGSVHGRANFPISIGGFVLLTVWRAPPFAVVVLPTMCGTGLGKCMSSTG